MKLTFSLLTAILLSVACAADAQQPAWESRNLAQGNSIRTWHEIVPLACTIPQARCPVLVALHGGGGSGLRFAEATGLATAASTRGYIVLAPDALGANWNDGRPQLAAGIDDVGFIRSMLAHLRRRVSVDPARIFAAGASNGGLMSFRLACEGGNTFRAVAPVIANMGTELIRHCRPGGNLSLFMIPGTADRLMPYEGGAVARGRGDRGAVVSADRTLDFWRMAMGCNGSPHTERFDPIRDETGVSITRFDSCRDGIVVQRWTVDGGGHTWPGAATSVPRLGAGLAGPTAIEFSATQVILDFFDAAGRTR
jgi:polyhydroxybutyrate depolymerase